MYKLFTDKSELFECDIKLEGASLSKSKARLVVETSDYSLLFDGSISSKGKCEIPIRKLKGLIDENTTGNIRLEVIAEDTFFTPWESDFEVDASKKVTVEVKSQTTKKPIVETKVDRFPTAEERWPRAGKQIEQVEVKPVTYFSKKTRPDPKLEETDVNSIAQAMSGLIKKPEQLDEQPQLSDLEKLQREFTQFKKLVSMQMASIGGGGEVRLLNLDDVDTSSLGNGKFLVFNSTTQKLEFTDQVDGN